jgi:hypothetical protein
MTKLNAEDGEDGDTPVLWNVVVDTWEGIISGGSQVMKEKGARQAHLCCQARGARCATLL